MSCCGKGPYRDGDPYATAARPRINQPDPYQTAFRNTRPIATPRKTTARCVDGFRKHKFSDRLTQIIAADNCLRCGAPNRGR